MRDSPVKLAVLGLGFMGSTHLKALAGVPGAELAAVYSSDECKLNGDLTAVRGNLGGPGEKYDFTAVTRHRTLEAVLADPDIEAVDICLPTDLHEPVAVEAMRAGKHVLVEKPMALDGYAADRMLAAASRSQRVLMTAQVLRFMPAYRALHDLVRDGELGRLRFASFRRQCAAPAWGGWLDNPEQSGGGVFDLLIHDVDMCLQLFGRPEAVAASGFSDPATGLDCIDAQLFYPGAATAVISGGWYHKSAFPFQMAYTVALEGGTAAYSSNCATAKLYVAGEPERDLASPDCDGYAAEIQYFADCCREGKTPDLCPPRESADAVKIMLILLESRSRAGRKMICRV